MAEYDKQEQERKKVLRIMQTNPNVGYETNPRNNEHEKKFDLSI